jgi:hypothetical protein
LLIGVLLPRTPQSPRQLHGGSVLAFGLTIAPYMLLQAAEVIE